MSADSHGLNKCSSNTLVNLASPSGMLLKKRAPFQQPIFLARMRLSYRLWILMTSLWSTYSMVQLVLLTFAAMIVAKPPHRTKSVVFIRPAASRHALTLHLPSGRNLVPVANASPVKSNSTIVAVSLNISLKKARFAVPTLCRWMTSLQICGTHLRRKQEHLVSITPNVVCDVLVLMHLHSDYRVRVLTWDWTTAFDILSGVIAAIWRSPLIVDAQFVLLLGCSPAWHMLCHYWSSPGWC